MGDWLWKDIPDAFTLRALDVMYNPPVHFGDLLYQRHRNDRKDGNMSEISWERYPHVAGFDYARTWLQMQANLCAKNTVEAYGRSLEDYLSFCVQRNLTPETATREDLAAYVHDLASRPRPRKNTTPTLQPEKLLANATMHLRLTTHRSLYTSLIDHAILITNPSCI